MDDIWDRIENYLSANVPLMLEGLAPGATEDEIASFESTVGYRLPEDLRLSLKRHNGQRHNAKDGNPIGGTLIPCCWELLSLKYMLDEWEEHRYVSEDIGPENDPDQGNPGVKPYFHHPARIPIAADIGGNSLCVDLDPDEGGTVGQIIEFNHEMDCPTRIEADFRTCLTALADGFEAGDFVYDSDTHFPGFERRMGSAQPSPETDIEWSALIEAVEEVGGDADDVKQLKKLMDDKNA